MKKEEREAKRCISEIEVILKKYGFLYLPVPKFKMTQAGWTVDVDLTLQKVQQKGA